MNLEQFSALDLGQKLARRELTSREAVGYFLERIARIDSKVRAFTHIAAEAALGQADGIDSRLAAGEKLGPLAGVPVAVKDVLCTLGIPTTCGSKMLENFRPPYSATVVSKLLDAGMVMLGKTNMDEFAMGGSTETGIHGPTHNPWKLTHTAGGSSGGSAASLAAGLTPLAIGSDTGGSIRQPAAFCGVCGLKPTYGRVSRYGLVAFASSLDQVGPMAHSVRDLAACLQVIGGHDPRDSTSLNEPSPDYLKSLDAPISGVRIGVVREQLESDGLAPEIRAAVAKAIDVLISLGARIVEIELPHSRYSIATYYLIAPCEASSNLARYDGAHYGFRANVGSIAKGESPLIDMYCRTRSEGFGAEVKRRIMLGTFALSAGYYDAYYLKAMRVRRLIANDFQVAFEKVDCILGPVAPTAAFRLGEKLDDPVQMYLVDLYTVGANLAGIPGLSIPAGQNSVGLPLAIQLQGPPLSEQRLLCVAQQLEQASFFQRRIANLP